MTKKELEIHYLKSLKFFNIIKKLTEQTENFFITNKNITFDDDIETELLKYLSIQEDETVRISFDRASSEIYFMDKNKTERKSKHSTLTINFNVFNKNYNIFFDFNYENNKFIVNHKRIKNEISFIENEIKLFEDCVKNYDSYMKLYKEYMKVESDFENKLSNAKRHILGI